MLSDRYVTFMAEKHPHYHNAFYKSVKLRDKLLKHFGDKIRCWQPRVGSGLIYSSSIQEGMLKLDNMSVYYEHCRIH